MDGVTSGGPPLSLHHLLPPSDATDKRFEVSQNAKNASEILIKRACCNLQNSHIG